MQILRCAAWPSIRHVHVPRAARDHAPRRRDPDNVASFRRFIRFSVAMAVVRARGCAPEAARQIFVALGVLVSTSAPSDENTMENLPSFAVKVNKHSPETA